MKKILNNFIYSFLLISLFSACEKEEDKLVFDPAAVKSGTLSISGSSFVLNEKDDANDAITFTTTAADFGFPAGVTYKLQIARKGTNFAAPKEEVMTGTEKKYTVKQLNSLVINSGGLAGSANQLEARIIAAAAEKITVISNVVTFTATPYYKLLDYPKVYVPGSYQGWAPDKAETLGSIDWSYENYEGYVNFTDAGTKFKITPNPDWSDDWGDENASGKSGKLKTKGADILADEAGYYFIKMNVTDLTYSIKKTSWAVVGDAQAGGWDKDTDMTYDAATKTWSVTLALTGGKAIKFRANDAWDINYGDGNDDSPLPDGFSDFNGKDIKVIDSGNYKVTLNLGNPGNYTYSLEKM